MPGRGGIASTKWIVGLDVIDRPFAGPFNAESYVFITEGEQVVRPVTVMPVKSVITTPVPGAQLAAGRQSVAGYAWSGYGGITKVEVSTDNGIDWAEATITQNGRRRSWVQFEHTWNAIPGERLARYRGGAQSALL